MKGTLVDDKNSLRVSNNTTAQMLDSFIRFIDASPNTVRTYRINLKQWFIYLASKNINKPKMDDVRNYKEELIKQGKKPNTIQNYIIAIKQFYRWTEIEGYYPNIAQYVKGVKVNRDSPKTYFTANQVKNILNKIDRSTIEGQRNYAMLLVMFTMGLRTIEVSRANVEDLRVLGDTPVLYIQGKGHVEKDQFVRMPTEVETVVRNYLSARDDVKDGCPLFASTSNRNQGGRIATRGIRRIVKTAFINAGYDSPRLTAHSTRHTTATLSLLNGATLQQTQALLRHKNMQTTEIYSHNLNAVNNEASLDVARSILGGKL